MLKQNFQLKLLQKLSPQQIQLMKLIQLPTQAFEQKLKQEVEENPALDLERDSEKDHDEDYQEDYIDEGNETIEADEINIDEYLSDDEIPNYKLQANNHSIDDEENQIPYASGVSFHQNLKSQLSTFSISHQKLMIAEFLVGSLDDSGYLRREIIDLVDDLAFTQNIYTSEQEVEEVLTNIIQTMEPIGVGARDLNECLTLQLQKKSKTKSVELAIAILNQSFELFVKKHYKKLLVKYGITETDLKDAISQIEKLNPKPGGTYTITSKITDQIVPDFTIQILDGVLHLSLNSRNAPELNISREYHNMLKGYQESKHKSKAQKDAVIFNKPFCSV